MGLLTRLSQIKFTAKVSHYAGLSCKRLGIDYLEGLTRSAVRAADQNDLNVTSSHYLYKYFKNEVNLEGMSTYQIRKLARRVRNIDNPVYQHKEKERFIAIDWHHGSAILLPQMDSKVIYAGYGELSRAIGHLHNLALRWSIIGLGFSWFPLKDSFTGSLSGNYMSTNEQIYQNLILFLCASKVFRYLYKSRIFQNLFANGQDNLACAKKAYSRKFIPRLINSLEIGLIVAFPLNLLAITINPYLPEFLRSSYDSILGWALTIFGLQSYPYRTRRHLP